MNKSVLELTRRELFQMTQEERNAVQRSLGVYLDTPDERRAREINFMILDINSLQWGF